MCLRRESGRTTDFQSPFWRSPLTYAARHRRSNRCPNGSRSGMAGNSDPCLATHISGYIRLKPFTATSGRLSSEEVRRAKAGVPGYARTAMAFEDRTRLLLRTKPCSGGVQSASQKRRGFLETRICSSTFGAGLIYISLLWRFANRFSFHHASPCASRHTTPSRGGRLVCGKNGQTRFDGSVLVTDAGFNPSLTIQAVAFRAAEYIKQQWKGSAWRNGKRA